MDTIQIDAMELPEEVIGFSEFDAGLVKSYFVCAVCWGELAIMKVSGDRICIVVCPEHGNIELCGRVTRNTVSIEIERGYRQYHEVIRNLQDLWGHLAQKGFEWAQSARLRKDYVCGTCGGKIYQELIDGDRDFVNLVCIRHGNINQAGYVKKELYNANLRLNKPK